MAGFVSHTLAKSSPIYFIIRLWRIIKIQVFCFSNINWNGKDSCDPKTLDMCPWTHTTRSDDHFVGMDKVVRSLAQRKPMLLFVFPGVLFRFDAKAPALLVLFQFPPRMKACCVLSYLSRFHYTSLVTPIQLVSIFPISLSFSTLIKYCFTLINRMSFESRSIIRK